MAPVGQMSCPTGAIQSFPLKMGITASDNLYDTVSEPLTISFQWAAKMTPPQFIKNLVSTIDDTGTNTSTLRFKNNKYSSTNVQIIQPSHNSWILPTSAQGSNKEDIAITFSSDDENLNTQYLTFIIPIIRTSSPSQPTYLKGLADPNSNGTFSLGQLLPTNTRSKFAYYSTCLSSVGSGTSTQNMYVFVSISGLNVSDTLMNDILSKVSLKQFSSKITAPFMTRLTGPSITIGSAEIFTKYVLTTTEVLNYANFQGQYARVNVNENTRVDDTSAYTCVPIDPEDAISNGQLTVNLDNGQVMSEVLAKRESTRVLHSLSGNLDPSRFVGFFESGLGIFMGVVLALLVLLFGYFAVRKYKGTPTDPAAASQTSQIMTILTNFSVYGVVVIVAAFGGFVIGAML